MDPNIWGPKFWFSLHCVSFTYPFNPDKIDKERYKTFFELLEHLLPCVLCRKNYSKNIKNYPIEGHLTNRKSLAYWVMDIHNMVNMENGKPNMTRDEMLESYEKQYGRKIFLDDPEPHITKKKLDDYAWQNGNGKFLLFPKWKMVILFILIFIFIIILLYLTYKLNPK
jgi:disulfide bond formation protein DsbB